MFHTTINSTAPILLVVSHTSVGAMSPEGWIGSYKCLKVNINNPKHNKDNDMTSSNPNFPTECPISLYNPKDEISFSAQ